MLKKDAVHGGVGGQVAHGPHHTEAWYERPARRLFPFTNLLNVGQRLTDWRRPSIVASPMRTAIAQLADSLTVSRVDSVPLFDELADQFDQLVPMFATFGVAAARSRPPAQGAGTKRARAPAQGSGGPTA